MYDYQRAVNFLKEKIGSPFRQEILKLLSDQGSLISIHFDTGMQIRNVLRKSNVFPHESELPEHFYDEVWMVLFLKALEITDEEIVTLSLESMLTNKEEIAQWTGRALIDIYREKIPLEVVCEKRLAEMKEYNKNYNTFPLPPP